MKEWIDTNYTFIVFGYGQVFFVIGLAVFLQSRRHSRLDLADKLRWIAAFGFLHGFFEWSGLLTLGHPIVSSTTTAFVFEVLRLILLACSFSCLLWFSIAFYREKKWLRFIPSGFFLVWLSSSALTGLVGNYSLEQWRSSAEVLARYLIGFPGAVMTALAIRRYAKTHIDPSDYPKVYRNFRISELSLLAYGLFSGLIGPRAPFFPASVINTETFMRVFALPPLIFRSVCGLVFAFLMVRALEIFDIESRRRITHMERASLAATALTRAGRDLHDTTFQRLYAAGLLARSLKTKFPHDDVIKMDVNRLMSIINEVITELQTFLLGVVEAEKSTDILAALESVIDEVRLSTDLEVRWNPELIPNLPAARVNEIVAFLRESLSNVIRHSQAHTAEVRLFSRTDRLHLTVVDDGCGLPADATKGYGLRDMRDRARLLGGEVTISSANGNGTAVVLDIPLQDTT